MLVFAFKPRDSHPNIDFMPIKQISNFYPVKVNKNDYIFCPYTLFFFFDLFYDEISYNKHVSVLDP